MARLFPSLLVALVGLGLAACTGDDTGTTSDDSEVPATRAALEAHEWLLDGATSDPTIDADGPATLAFVGNRVAGDGPCNAYSAKVSIDGDRVRIGNVSQTLVFCGEGEEQYFATLEVVDTAQLDDGGNQLTLSGGNDLRLVFDAIDTAGVIQDEWHIVNVNTGDAIVGVVDGSDPTLTFEKDGTVLVEAGCNSGSATWELDGKALTIESLVLTERACNEPAGVMDQETALVEAIESAARVEVTPAQLTILDTDDRMLLVATPEG